MHIAGLDGLKNVSERATHRLRIAHYFHVVFSVRDPACRDADDAYWLAFRAALLFCFGPDAYVKCYETHVSEHMANAVISSAIVFPMTSLSRRKQNAKISWRIPWITRI